MTCLCLTRNRREWLPQAIRCYQSQTYSNKGLLILSDGEDVKDLLPDEDDSIRLVHLDEQRNIGEKRNFGCSQARGSEIIAHWDDDDCSAPERLTCQVERLLVTGLAVTGYRDMRFTDGAKWWRYRGSSLPWRSHQLTYVLGTSLCYRRAWWEQHPFESKQVSEDTGFAATAAKLGQLDQVQDAGELMHATIHQRNTSPRELGLECWTELTA